MTRLFIVISLLWGAFACNGDDEATRPDYGTASALLNGEPWDIRPIGAGTSPCYPNTLSMRFEHYSEDGGLISAFAFTNFPAQAGKYYLYRHILGRQDCGTDSTSASFGTLLQGGHVLGEAFHVVEAANNRFVVTSYDSVAQRINGEFRVTMAINRAFSIDTLDFPDTLRITDGKFSVKIIPEEE